MTRLIIAGGGLAGGLAALALNAKRPDVEIMLVEQGEQFGGNHTWSFFETDIDPGSRWVIESVAALRWHEHEVRFPRRERIIPIAYNSIRSESLDTALRRALRPDQFRTGRRIQSVGLASVVLEGGERIDGDAVIDARGPCPMPGIELGWQKFAGRVYHFPEPHGVPRPMIMDATVEQSDGYRFLYRLPFSTTELLLEDTYYSLSPTLDAAALEEGLDRTAQAIGANAVVRSEEQGVLPVVLGGEVDRLWQGEPIARLGIRGGFFHPTTGYSLPDAAANAALLVEQRAFDSAALHALLRQRAEQLWQERSFFQLLNRMLFRAAAPGEAYRVLEHFYRLPAALIARFYGARLTAFDKVRLLSGRPPVPIGRALGALRSSAA